MNSVRVIWVLSPSSDLQALGNENRHISPIPTIFGHEFIPLIHQATTTRSAARGPPLLGGLLGLLLGALALLLAGSALALELPALLSCVSTAGLQSPFLQLACDGARAPLYLTCRRASLSLCKVLARTERLRTSACVESEIGG